MASLRDRAGTWLMRFRFAVEPAIGVLFFALWLTAEAGRLQSCTLEQVGCTDEVQTQLNVQSAGIVILLGVYSLAIALARRLPLVSVLLVLAVPLLQLGQVFAPFTATSWPIHSAALPVLFLVAVSAAPLVRWVALGVGLFHAGLVSYLVVGQAHLIGALSDGEGFFAVVALLGIVAWTTGTVVRVNGDARRGRDELDQAATELAVTGYELAVARERDRIAGEVHDVLAHSLTVVVAVADGSRFAQATRPETTPTALREIADTARGALLELRRLIEGLRDVAEDEPELGLRDIPRLVSRITSAGVAVASTTTGTAAGLGREREFAVYRIVQEGLTNVLRHAGAEPTAELGLSWSPAGLTGRLASRGARAEEISETTLLQRTYGVSGMRERARRVGGSLQAGREEGSGDYVVTFFIPVAAPGPDAPGAVSPAGRRG